jgi:hypothetical protein
MKSLEYLFLFLPLIIHLLIDKTGLVSHKLNGWLAGGFSLAIGFFVPQDYFWQGTIYALTIHFALFDFLYNAVHKHPMFYHGSSNNPDRALFDKIFSSKYLPPIAELFVKAWVLSVGVGVYYYLDKIIGL